MREMKDSGIEWIGEIPKEWEIAKLKNVCTRIIVGLATSVTQYYQDDGIPMFRNLNIKETGLDTEDVLFLNPEWAEKQEGKKIHTDDILTVHTGYIGISCLVPKDYDDCLTFTTLISTVDNKYAIPKYINYWINISRFFSLIYKSVDTGAQINLNIAEFVNLETVVPPLLVQQSVVNYLDEKCTKIDAIIEKQQEIIERLKEYKLSVITEAVTKGLNPDAEMKDSGIEWIGEIPNHCCVTRAGHIYNIILGKMLSPNPKDESDTLECYYCAANVHFEGVDNSSLKQMWFSKGEKEQYLVKKDDLLVVEGGAGAGGAAVVKEDDENVYVQNSIMIVRNDNPTAA